MTVVPGARILALAKYGARAASTRQRLLQYVPFLENHGMSVTLRPLLDDTYLAGLMSGERSSSARILAAYARRLGDAFAARDYDAIWVQYELLPYLPLIDGVLARIASKPIVYDIDDAIFHMYDAHSSAVVRGLLGGKLRPLMRRAALSLCGNDYLRDYVVAAGGRASVVPTVVDTADFRPAPREPGSPLTVGWIGSPSTWRYVEPLLPVLLPAMARIGARFRVVGAGPAARGIDGIDALEWSEDREVADIQAMDIGLMPVPDQPWARGKCGYKLIQYMACGLPGIASPVGVNRTLVQNGIDGFLVNSEEEWIGALNVLAEDPSRRKAMGEIGRDRMVRHYSLHSQQPAMLDAFRTAMGGRL